MAIDEAIADAVASSGAVAPTLRFYGWSRPTLSLGYFQPHAAAKPWISLPVDIVRRSTGGGAIMHHHELTYSLALPLSDSGPGARQSIYQNVHKCIAGVLAACGVIARPYREISPQITQSGFPSPGSQADRKPAGLVRKTDEPFLCFQRRTEEDLICSGYKILGSAQRRLRGGVLQHGSLLLSTSPLADSLPGIAELSSHKLDPLTLCEAIAKRLGQTMSIDWHVGELSRAEEQASTQIQRTRYGCKNWTNRR